MRTADKPPGNRNWNAIAIVSNSIATLLGRLSCAHSEFLLALPCPALQSVLYAVHATIFQFSQRHP